MIDNHPTPIAISVDKAERRRTSDFLAVPDLRKGIRPGVDGDVTIDANALLTEDSLVRWRDSAQDVEVLATRRGSVTKRGRPSASQRRLMMTSLQVLRMVEGASDSLAWHGAAMMRWPIQGVKNS